MIRRGFLATLLLAGFLGLASYQTDGQPLSPDQLASDMLMDKKGVVRYRHIGEGVYEETEATIQELLAEEG
jgi:hypothetical protein